MTPSTEIQRILELVADAAEKAWRYSKAIGQQHTGMQHFSDLTREAARSAGGEKSRVSACSWPECSNSTRSECAFRFGPCVSPAPADTTAQTDVERIRQLEGWLSEASVAVGGADLDCVGAAILGRFAKIEQHLYKAAQWTEFLPDTRKNAEYLCSAVDQARFHILVAQEQLPKPMTRIGFAVPPETPGPQPVSEPARAAGDGGRPHQKTEADSAASVARSETVPSPVPTPPDAAQGKPNAGEEILTFPVYPDLHDDSKHLVQLFAQAVAYKLHEAQIKYGYSNGWLTDDWEHKCRADLHEHIGKGDPLDVAIYAAFMWNRGWATSNVTAPTPSHPEGRAGELRECPFCQGTRTEIVFLANTSGAGRMVRCHKCLAEGPPKPEKAEAIAAWNSRAPLEKPRGEAGERTTAVYAADSEARQPPGGWMPAKFLNEVGQFINCQFYIPDGHYIAGRRVETEGDD